VARAGQAGTQQVRVEVGTDVGVARQAVPDAVDSAVEGANPVVVEL